MNLTQSDDVNKKTCEKFTSPPSAVLPAVGPDLELSTFFPIWSTSSSRGLGLAAMRSLPIVLSLGTGHPTDRKKSNYTRNIKCSVVYTLQRTVRDQNKVERQMGFPGE